MAYIVTRARVGVYAIDNRVRDRRLCVICYGSLTPYMLLLIYGHLSVYLLLSVGPTRLLERQSAVVGSPQIVGG